jgi:hypothetical protein
MRPSIIWYKTVKRWAETVQLKMRYITFMDAKSVWSKQ